MGARVVVTLSPALAQVLAAGRPQFNARVVEARRRHPTFDTQAFSSFLADGVDRVASSVAAVAPDRTMPVVSTAFDMALDLVGQQLAGPGARSRAVDRVWSELAPRCAARVAEQPQTVLAALTNAAVHIAKVRSPDAWLSRMIALAPRAANVAELLALGQVVAWRSGLAHFRDGALRVAQTLPEPLVLAAVGARAEAKWAEILPAIQADPWWSPADAPGVRSVQPVEVGAFAGFGGAFDRLPEVRACAEGFLVRSGDRHHLLVADVFGAVLQPSTADEFEQAPMEIGGAVRLKGATVAMWKGEVTLDLPADGLRAAGNAHTVAVTSPHTYSIRLVPRS